MACTSQALWKLHSDLLGDRSRGRVLSQGYTARPPIGLQLASLCQGQYTHCNSRRIFDRLSYIANYIYLWDRRARVTCRPQSISYTAAVVLLLIFEQILIRPRVQTYIEVATILEEQYTKCTCIFLLHSSFCDHFEGRHLHAYADVKVTVDWRNVTNTWLYLGWLPGWLVEYTI